MERVNALDKCFTKSCSSSDNVFKDFVRIRSTIHSSGISWIRLATFPANNSRKPSIQNELRTNWMNSAVLASIPMLIAPFEISMSKSSSLFVAPPMDQGGPP